MSDHQARYLPALTAMRGIAAIWVMLFHIDVSLFYRDLGPLIPHEATGLITGGYMWVDFFFILSGFVITHVYAGHFADGLRMGEAWRYLRARFFRIYPLHLFTLLLLIVFWQFMEGFQASNLDASMKTYFDPAALPSNFLLTNAMNQYVFLSWNIVSWSIGAEWWTYFIAILILLVAMRRFAAELLVLGGFVGVCLLVQLHPEGKLDLTYNYGFYRCLFEFAMGVGIYKLYQRGAGKALMATDSFMMLMVAAVVAAFHFDLNDLLMPPLFALMVMAAAYNRSGFERVMKGRMLQYLGKISYSIYLMHGVWFMVFWTYLPTFKNAGGFADLPPLYAFAYAGLFIGVSIVSAAFTYRFVEVPGRVLFRRRPRAVAQTEKA